MRTLLLAESKKILTEAASIEKIEKALRGSGENDFTDCQYNELMQLFMADPTSSSNDRGKFVGKYWKWILSLYKNKKISIKNSIDLSNALNIYNINKVQIGRNIKEFSSLEDLKKVTKNYTKKNNIDRTLSKAEQNLEKVYEDQYVVIYIPHTWEAARKIGGDTRWCTASSDKEQFDFYKNTYGGEYYDIIRKSDGAKFQFHPESEQLKDSNDVFCYLSDIFQTKKEALGTINFFSKRCENFYLWNLKSWPEEFEEKLNNGLNLRDIFDCVKKLNNGISIGFLSGNDSYFVIKRKKLLFREGFRSFDFINGNIFLQTKDLDILLLDKKCNQIDILNNKVNISEYLKGDHIRYIGDKISIFEIFCSYIIVDSKSGYSLFNDTIKNFPEKDINHWPAFIQFTKTNKGNYLRTDGTLMFDKENDLNLSVGSSFIKGKFAFGKFGKKWDFFDINGKSLFNLPIDDAFDSIHGYYDGLDYLCHRHGKFYLIKPLKKYVGVQKSEDEFSNEYIPGNLDENKVRKALRNELRKYMR